MSDRPSRGGRRATRADDTAAAATPAGIPTGNSSVARPLGAGGPTSIHPAPATVPPAAADPAAAAGPAPSAGGAVGASGSSSGGGAAAIGLPTGLTAPILAAGVVGRPALALGAQGVDVPSTPAPLSDLAGSAGTISSQSSKTGTLWRRSRLHEERLAQLIIAEDAFGARHGSVKATWDTIAATLNREFETDVYTGRNVQARGNLIVAELQELDDAERRSKLAKSTADLFAYWQRATTERSRKKRKGSYVPRALYGLEADNDDGSHAEYLHDDDQETTEHVEKGDETDSDGESGGPVLPKAATITSAGSLSARQANAAQLIAAATNGAPSLAGSVAAAHSVLAAARTGGEHAAMRAQRARTREAPSWTQLRAEYEVLQLLVNVHLKHLELEERSLAIREKEFELLRAAAGLPRSDAGGAAAPGRSGSVAEA